MMRLAKPILATMNGHSALILDIGIADALIEHFGDATPGEKFRLEFRWKAASIEYLVETGRTIVVRHPGGDGKSVVSHTVVHFVEPIGDSQARLQDLMSTFVQRVIQAQRANAAGDTSDAAILAELGGARRVRNRGYVSYLLKDGKWWRVPGTVPDQPTGEGFTVAAHEDEEELNDLCHAYEQSDEEGRKLIRRIAELSAGSVTR